VYNVAFHESEGEEMVTAINQVTQPQARATDWPSLRRWTVQDYHRLDDAGFFRPDERVELIDGVICAMSPKRTTHTVTTRLTSKALMRRVGDVAGICIQNPITLDDYSEPEPDIVVVIDPDPQAYLGHHPRPEDVLLLIEIAESSLDADRNVKGPVYARAGIKDYWILNLVDGALEVRRNPTSEGYQTVTIYQPEEAVAPLAFPDLSISVSELLPQQNQSDRIAHDGS
jgi:Uma2 family endonuclease